MRRHASVSVVSPQAIVGSIAVLALSGVFAVVVVACGSSASGSHRADIDATLRQALRDEAAGKLGTARKEYEDVLAKDRSNKYARYDLGLIAQTQGDDKTAAHYYRLALESDPHFKAALFNLAIVRTEAGSIDEAMSLYRQVIALDPSNAGAHLNLGLLYMQNHQVDAGQGELHEAVMLNPSLRSRLPQSAPAVGVALEESVGAADHRATLNASATATATATAPAPRHDRLVMAAPRRSQWLVHRA